MGGVDLAGAPMTVLASDGRTGQPKPFTSNPILGKDTSFFPDVSLSFFSYRDNLVPTTQDVVRNGSLPGTRSFWDIVVQPGRIWSDPDDPVGWNRAAFPFALTQGAGLGDDSETRHGLALFLYRGHQISPVRFQLVQQTGAPCYVQDYFTAWGVAEAIYQPGDNDRLGGKHTFQEELAHRLPVAPWSALPEEVSNDPLVQAFTTDPDADPHVLVRAVAHDGVLYRSDYRTAAGPYPYCDEMRYGIMSVTKATMLGMARLRLAQKYGAGFLHEPIADYLQAARRPGWNDVTFHDLANMSSGHYPSPAETYYEIPENYDDPHWNCWVEQRTEHGRTGVALSSYPRTYQPGSEHHYINQDAYLLGVALDALLKSKEGPEASAWEMLRHEVFRPIGIYHLPSTSTIEEDGSTGQPTWSAGYYPTLEDLAKLGLLMQNRGAWGGRQILHRGLVDSLMPSTTPPWERSGVPNSTYYQNWRFQNEGSWWVPFHSGFGGSALAILPSGTVAIRTGNGIDGARPEDYAAEWPPLRTCAPRALGADGSLTTENA